MSDFFWIGMELGFGFYCAISVTDLLTEIVKTIINKRKEMKK